MNGNWNSFIPKENASAEKQSVVMTKEKPSIIASKESSPPTQTFASKPSPTQTSTPKPSPIQMSKPPPSTHPTEDVQETPKTLDDTQTTQTQQEVEVNMLEKFVTLFMNYFSTH